MIGLHSSIMKVLRILLAVTIHTAVGYRIIQYALGTAIRTGAGGGGGVAEQKKGYQNARRNGDRNVVSISFAYEKLGGG